MPRQVTTIALGANEAPPAIISIFLGDQLADVFEQIKNGVAKSSIDAGTLTLGVDTLPSLPKHAGDRNRTSPFAFTGNKFEFRAVGSNQSISNPITVLNTILTESLDFMASYLEEAEGDFYQNVQTLLTDIMQECAPIIFNGDGYSEAWHEEAEQRGLPNLRTSVDAIPEFASKDAVDLFKKYGVLTPIEVESRRDVYLERYILTVQVEAKLTYEIGKTMIWPAAIRYQNELASTCANLKAVGYTFDTHTLDRVTALVRDLQDSLDTLNTLLDHENHDLLVEATYACNKVLPAMLQVRAAADELEGIVADDLWPLPTYQEMLFIR